MSARVPAASSSARILLPGVDWQLSGDERSTSRYFNTSAFAAPPTGPFGNVGKNTVIGPGMANLDLVLAKRLEGRRAH